MEEDPFGDLKISDPKFLDEIAARTECSKCGRTRKYYCYTCYVPMTCIKDLVPNIKLPIKIDVIKHPSEVDGKSTAVHAAVLAPDDVKIYTYPAIPDYDDPSRVILIFPGEKSVTLEELAGVDAAVPNIKTQDLQNNTDACSQSSTETTNIPQPASEAESLKRKSGDTDQEPDVKKKRVMKEAPYDRVVFIDSTWNQTMKIYKDERLKGLRQVELKTRTTKFWRWQKDKPNTYLATIEAIYYFVVDHHKLFVENPDEGSYDDLLFFFSYMYHKIRNLYSGGDKLRAYKTSLRDTSADTPT